jgi:hypothetical protein
MPPTCPQHVHYYGTHSICKQPTDQQLHSNPQRTCCTACLPAAAVALTTNPPANAICTECALHAHAANDQSAVLNGQWLCIINHLSATRRSQPSQAVWVRCLASN